MTDPTDDDIDEIIFTPVPLRARRDGWTEARQRGFIRGLRRCGSVGAAARSVGKSARTAYRLRERPGAESFAKAWDMAVEMGTDHLRDHVIDRALHGAVVPRFYRGRQCGVIHRHYDRLACAVLGGEGRNIGAWRAAAEQAGATTAFFDIEAAWQRDRDEMNAALDRASEAEERIARLESEAAEREPPFRRTSSLPSIRQL